MSNSKHSLWPQNLARIASYSGQVQRKAFDWHAERATAVSLVLICCLQTDLFQNTCYHYIRATINTNHRQSLTFFLFSIMAFFFFFGWKMSLSFFAINDFVFYMQWHSDILKCGWSVQMHQKSHLEMVSSNLTESITEST